MVTGAGQAGARPAVVFSHANGFPAATYRKLLEGLRTHFDVSHVSRFGHAPEYPVERGWSGLRQQLLDHLATLPASQPVLLVGHSLGGYLSLLAAAALPDRVSGIVLLDAPIIGGVAERMIKLGRRTGFDRYLMPLRETLRRRVHWPDIDSVRAHFAMKPLFSGWDEEMLRDYAEYGTEVDADLGGRRLLFDREVEHRIYDTLPTSTVRLAATSLEVPVAFVAGTRSREVRIIGMRGTRRLVGKRLRWIEGGHLFPMERPQETTDLVVGLIASMRGGQTAA